MGFFLGLHNLTLLPDITENRSYFISFLPSLGWVKKCKKNKMMGLQLLAFTLILPFAYFSFYTQNKSFWNRIENFSPGRF